MMARTLLVMSDIELFNLRIELEKGAHINVPDVKWIAGISDDYIGVETLNDGFVWLDDMSAPIKGLNITITKWRDKDGK